MARFYRWLVGRDYWLVYFVVYVGVMIGLAIWRRPDTLSRWSDVVTVSIGIASGVAIVLEVLGMLLIKPAVERLLKQGEKQERDRWVNWYREAEAARKEGKPVPPPPAE